MIQPGMSAMGFAGSSDTKLHGFRLATGGGLVGFPVTTTDPISSSPAIAGGKVYFGPKSQVFYAYFTSGGLAWSKTLNIQIGGSLTANVANYNDTVPGYRRRWLVVAGPASAAGAVPNLRQITVRVIPEVTDRRVASTYELVSIIHRW